MGFAQPNFDKVREWNVWQNALPDWSRMLDAPRQSLWYAWVVGPLTLHVGNVSLAFPRWTSWMCESYGGPGLRKRSLDWDSALFRSILWTISDRKAVLATVERRGTMNRHTWRYLKIQRWICCEEWCRSWGSVSIQVCRCLLPAAFGILPCIVKREPE